MLRPGVPLTIVWGAALFFLAAFKKVSKAGKVPPFSRNPSLGPKRTLRQSRFLLRSLDFLHLQIGELLPGCVPPLSLFTNMSISPRSQLAGLTLLCAQGPAWGRCSGSAVGGSVGAATGGGGGRIAQLEAGFEPLSRTLSAAPCLAFWSGFILSYTSPPPHAPPMHHQVRGTNCDNCFIVSTTFRLEGCSLASPHASRLHHTGQWLRTAACFLQPVVCLLICSLPQVTGSITTGCLGDGAALGAGPREKPPFLQVC